MTNFYEETAQALKENHVKWSDIKYIGSKNIEIPIGIFIKLAKQTYYGNSYGVQFIPKDLVMVTKKGIFIREEYDGSEWWGYIPFNYRGKFVTNLNTIVSSNGWETLRQIYKEQLKSEA